jgi:aspartate ammonia-lyase
MAQSSNDVIPTAVRLATLMALVDFKKEMTALAKSLEKKGSAYVDLVKVGRTHLQDAVPVTLGQEFMAYASAIRTGMVTLKEAESSLCILGIGGTATGTGITTHPQFQKTVVTHLSNLSGFKLKPAPNLIETTHSMAPLLKISAALRAVAVEVNRIANDIRLMVMGPLAGINELHIPEVEPGSSIMPGKVNPSVPECLNMICFQVIANDGAVSLGAQGGQLELNWFTPLILKNLTESIEILTNGLRMFRTDCIDHVRANEPRIRQLFEGSLVTATALAPYLGYHRVALLVNEALEKKKPLKEVVRAHKLMTDADLERILKPEAMVKPSMPDLKLMQRLRKV